MADTQIILFIGGGAILGSIVVNTIANVLSGAIMKKPRRNNGFCSAHNELISDISAIKAGMEHLTDIHTEEFRAELLAKALKKAGGK